MTGRDLVDFIENCKAGQFEIEVQRAGLPENIIGLELRGEKVVITVEEWT